MIDVAITFVRGIQKRVEDSTLKKHLFRQHTKCIFMMFGLHTTFYLDNHLDSFKKIGGTEAL